MGDVQKACESIIAEANELWVEMGLNAEQCQERRNRFSAMIRQSLKDLLQKVCDCSFFGLFSLYFTISIFCKQLLLIVVFYRKSLNEMQ